MLELSQGPAPYGPIDPNSQHQLWSRWVFGVMAGLKQPTTEECIANARRFFPLLFKSLVGRVRCDRRQAYYRFAVEIEGPPAHDPEYVEAVEREVRDRFVTQGFGASAALLRFRVKVLAGDKQDGKPRDQLLVMPSLILGGSGGERTL